MFQGISAKYIPSLTFLKQPRNYTMISANQVSTNPAMQHVLPLAISQFRKDWPFMAQRLDEMRERAAVRGRAAAAPRLLVCAALSQEGPDGNHGDNKSTTATAAK